MGIKNHLVKDVKSTARRSEKVNHRHYLTYNPGPGTQDIEGTSVTYVIPVDLPAGATDIGLHGPGLFYKRGRGRVYGVRITFTEESKQGEEVEHGRTIELPDPAVNVQLLDRKPDEAYKAVA